MSFSARHSPPAPIIIPTSHLQDPFLPPETPRRRTGAHLSPQSGLSPKEQPSDAACSEAKSTSRSTSRANLLWHPSHLQHPTHDTPAVVPEIMGRGSEKSSEEQDSLLRNGESSTSTFSRNSEDSVTTASSTSLVLENLNHISHIGKPSEPLEYRDDASDPELPYWKEGFTDRKQKSMSRRLKIIMSIITVVAVAGWSIALFGFLTSGAYRHASQKPFDHESPSKSSGKRVGLEHVGSGYFSPHYQSLRWIDGPNGEDGLLLEVGRVDKDFLVVEDIRKRQGDEKAYPSRTLLKSPWQNTNDRQIYAAGYWPSPDQKKVLILSDREKVYRHSFTGVYHIVDVETQDLEPLDPANPEARVQLAQWAPTSDSIVFTKDNNMYLRTLSSKTVRQITKDGGPEYFYGIPDWAYEEEVFQGNTATWWAKDGQHIAFMRTNETVVPEYPVQFFMNRPSKVTTGLENYPDTTQIKYPKAGAPNPIVELLFYDVAKNEVFTPKVGEGFADDDRIIADVMWTDKGFCLVREVNRVSDHIRMVLIDVPARSGKAVRTENIKELDGGWVEPAQNAQYIPADPANGRPDDGYLDVVIHGDNTHFAYFTPMDSKTPIMLTSGAWDIDSEASFTLDLQHNILYFVAAKEQPTSRHVYSVDLAGGEITAIVPIDKPAYYGVDFSAKGGYGIFINAGPGIPTQSVVSLPSNPNQYNETLADNKELAKLAASHELPHTVWTNVTVDGFTLQVMEKRPPHFDPSKKYPVLFYQYSGPGSQSVTRKFDVDFQSYIASSLEYIVVTVDGRGTGFIGRKAMCITRGELGKYEATDQIETAKIWAEKPYVDSERMAIWGWSFGGFTTLKVLEQDAGQTFKYGMAVAPVTDWRFYDSIYTERYMFKPQDNQEGYDRSAVTNVHNMSQNVRFLVMHGTGDDNVHMQNTLTLIDKLDMATITNYDVHFFPDSNHNIAFHGANPVIYQKLEKWLVSAFNGEWYKYQDPVPLG